MPDEKAAKFAFDVVVIPEPTQPVADLRSSLILDSVPLLNVLKNIRHRRSSDF